MSATHSPITRMNAAILCGGEGKRLWPVSRKDHPKQFGVFAGDDDPMITHTAKRLEALGTQLTLGQAVAIGGQGHGFLIDDHVADYGFETILEPVARDSAAAIAAISALMEARDEGDVPLIVCPSDHLIKDSATFCRDALAAASATADYDLVLMGIPPTHAETGYGYFEVDQAALDPTAHAAIVKFHEKPDAETASRYVSNSLMYWNSGIFIFQPAKLIDLLARLNPRLLELCRAAVKGASDDLNRLVLDAEPFSAIKAGSFDYEVVEKAENIGAIRAGFDWTDLGSWTAVSQTHEADEHDTVAVGKGVSVGARNSFVSSSGPLLVAHDVEDIVAVATPDAVLVTRQENSQNVKTLIDLLAPDYPEMSAHQRVYRPWGWYESIARGSRFQVKRICVKPQAVLSLQRHVHRAEHWVVVEGVGLVEIDGKTWQMNENESTFVPIGAVHRLSNPGKIPLVIIEVQTGSYLGEDDIVRLDDIYGRKEQDEANHD